MSLLELKNIGKIYASEGNVAVGIRGVNLSFDRGEFVAVTGASGSGKSTLLNVISGMDSYEEGEMFVEGEPTSHYLQPDWEQYRSKYISFIFQDYNIIESFTVLQNVELALMDIPSKTERRATAIRLLKRVGLERVIHQKGSKLSGGQKQRTVIARALAKDSPIILADEPTGNLDAATSREIVELLREISSDKLVIVVTHSFDELENVASRHIRVFDGAVESDRVLFPTEKNTEKVKDVEALSRKGVISNGLSLGMAIFTSKPLLSFFMCFLLIVGTLGVFGLTISSGDAGALFEKYYMFTYQKGRTVIARRDGTPLTDEELEKLKTEYGAERAVHYDFLTDMTDRINFLIPAETVYYKKEPRIRQGFEEFGMDLRTFSDGMKDHGKIIGEYPDEYDEVFLYLPIDYASKFNLDDFSPVRVVVGYNRVTVTGIKTYRNTSKQPIAYVSTEMYDRIAGQMLFDAGNYGGMEGELVFSMKDGSAFSYFTGIEEDGSLSDYQVALVGDDKLKEQITDDFTFTLSGTPFYGGGKVSFSHKGELADAHKGEVTDGSYIIAYYSPKFRDELVKLAVENEKNGYKQASLYFSDDRSAKNAAEKISATGDYVAVTSNAEYQPSLMETIDTTIYGVISAILWVLGIIFIAFFINLCSSKTIGAFSGEMAIMRSMGIPTKVIRLGMYFRMLISAIPAYVLTIISAFVIYSTPSITRQFVYIGVWQYAVIFIGVFLIVVRVTGKQIKKLFGESVKKSIRGGRT